MSKEQKKGMSKVKLFGRTITKPSNSLKPKTAKPTTKPKKK